MHDMSCLTESKLIERVNQGLLVEPILVLISFVCVGKMRQEK